MPTYRRHEQLKKIRRAVGKTQKQLAEMLGVSYPYLLSVETGQRDMSEPLARKLTWLFGLSNDIRSKKASPTAWDPIQKGRVPFSLDTFRKHSLQLPTFRIPDNTANIEDQVTPTLKDYSKAFHAMLESAKSTGRLGPLLENFFALFREYASSDAAIDAFMASYRRLYPHGKRDAQRALIADVYMRSMERKKTRKRKRI